MRINDHKIAFIICTNDMMFCKESLYYISMLDIPNGYEVDIITVEGAEYITKAYNKAMRESDAKYKVYLHQDVFIVNKMFIHNILDVFKNSRVGMIGLAGITYVKEFLTTQRWNKGTIFTHSVFEACRDDFGMIKGQYESVQAIDGMMMVTQYDVPWREDIITGWDYYDISQSMEFLKNGYEIVVPNCEVPWVLHDHGVLNYTNYLKWKKVFVEEYADYVESISPKADCMLRIEKVIEKLEMLFSINDLENAEKLIISARKVPELYNDVVAIYDANISFNKGDYSQMWEAIRRGLKNNPKNYELYVLLGEYYLDKNPDQAYLCFENALFYCDNEADSVQIQELITSLKREKEIKVNNVSFIILSYNTLDFTKTCVESIRENTLPSSREIVIVDNASTDGSLEWLREQGDIVLRANTENSGFPKGCNQGVEVATKGNDVFLLNNDTLLPPNALFWLRMGLYEDDTVGATGSVTNFAANLQALTFEDNSTENMLRYAIANNVPEKYPYEEKLHLVGFALLIKRSVYDLVGDLDERFSPGNYEDNDYGIRVIKAGYKNILCRNSFILHFGSKSFGKKAEAYAKLLATNAKKFTEKWGVDPSIYFEPRPSMVNLIKEEKEAEINVLDVGCGGGATCAYLKGQYPNAKVHGVEMKPEVADIAMHMADVLCADIENMEYPWEEEYFDYIFMVDVLEYLKEPEEVLKKLQKYLKKDGHIILRVPNVKHYSVLLPLIMHDAFPIDGQSRYSGTSFMQMVLENGYELEQCVSVVLGQPSDNVDRLLDKMVELSGAKDKNAYLAYQYVIKAKKC